MNMNTGGVLRSLGGQGAVFELPCCPRRTVRSELLKLVPRTLKTNKLFSVLRFGED